MDRLLLLSIFLFRYFFLVFLFACISYRLLLIPLHSPSCLVIFPLSPRRIVPILVLVNIALSIVLQHSAF
ncbi:hypothetical protein F5H01DRAFT_328306, partial [Linnemannia elongata]